MNLTKTTCVILASASLALTVAGADWYVAPGATGDGTATSDRGDLMDVLYNGQIAAGDTIHLAVGIYNLDANKSPEGHIPGYGGYLLAKADNLSFIGESDNPEDVRLVGNPSDQMRIFVIYNGGCALRNLLMTGGYTIAQGAGICIANALIGNPAAAFCASNCVVENCSASYQGGGGFGGLWRDCVIRNNETRNKVAWPEGSAGGVFHAILHDCVITNNSAGFCGGGIAGGRQNGATDTARPICETRAYNCLIGWNRSVYGGGGAVAPENLARGYCQLFGCTLVENAAAYDETGDGGGLGGGAYQCVVSNCVVRGNEATRPGGRTFVAYGHNYGYSDAGGLMDCTVFDSTIVGNRCNNGGGGAANSDLTRCEFFNNSATWADWPHGFGGGTYGCTVTDSVLAGNYAGYGGAACNGYLENCVMTNNQATVYEGGATYSANTRNCLVARNTSKMYYAVCKGTHYGTLVYGNVNEKIDVLGASGIGADAGEPDAVAVNCTVWNNDNSSAQVSRTYMTNCIVGSVEYIPCAVNSFWRYGTVDNQTGCISGEGLNPKFEGVTLADTPTTVQGFAPEAFAIRAGSPCRDKGLTLAGQANEKDLLGNKRVKYAGVDMGALECCGGLAFFMVVR